MLNFFSRGLIERDCELSPGMEEENLQILYLTRAQRCPVHSPEVALEVAFVSGGRTNRIGLKPWSPALDAEV
jgi:hypothetical protein